MKAKPLNPNEAIIWAQETIQRYERVKVLQQYILSEIGLTFETGKQMFDKMKELFDDYEESLQILKTVIEAHGQMKQQTQTNGSDYGSGQFEHLKTEGCVS